MAIVKLSFPRLFVRFNYEDSYFSDFEDWKSNIAVCEWLDGERPSAEEQQEILKECWNFLCVQEDEEERQAILREEEGEEGL